MQESIPGFEKFLKMNMDQIYTPDWVAKDMCQFFNPIGKVLEPAAGNGVFLKYVKADHCEITEGTDFFNVRSHYDYIIGNPPYSIFSRFLDHSLELADNIIFILPLFKVFNSQGTVNKIAKYGWISHIRLYGGGNLLKFPMGNAIGAFHLVRSHILQTEFSFYKK